LSASGEGLLEDLDLECLASELAVQLAYPLLETVRIGRRDHVVIGANRFVATLLSSAVSDGTPASARP
jgi:hypothetical protein